MENLTDDYYEFIGVKRDASNIEIKKECNRLLLKYHPDRCKAIYADRITQLIYEIKETLLDAEKRKAYNKTLPQKKDKMQEIKKESPVRKAKEDEERKRKERKDEQKKSNDGARQPTNKSFCEFCGEDVTLSFKCYLCGGRYCADHRLPKEHDCSNSSSSQPEARSQEREPYEVARQNKPWIYSLRSRSEIT
jgi:DnaJ-class molecular chaperone